MFTRPFSDFVLQCVAVCCSVLQLNCARFTRLFSDLWECLLDHNLTLCCSVLQCVAVCCSVLQCVAVEWPRESVSSFWVVCCSTANPNWDDIFESSFKAQSFKLKRLFCRVSVKRDVRALSFELWALKELSKMSAQVGLAVYCSVLQCVAVCCSILQCAAVEGPRECVSCSWVVSHINESCERVMSQACLSRDTSVNAPCHSCQSVTLQVWMSLSQVWICHKSKSVTGVYESCHRCEWVCLRFQCDVTRVNQSCHMCEWAMLHVWMSHLTGVNGSCACHALRHT